MSIVKEVRLYPAYTAMIKKCLKVGNLHKNCKILINKLQVKNIFMLKRIRKVTKFPYLQRRQMKVVPGKPSLKKKTLDKNLLSSLSFYLL